MQPTLQAGRFNLPISIIALATWPSSLHGAQPANHNHNPGTTTLEASNDRCVGKRRHRYAFGHSKITVLVSL